MSADILIVDDEADIRNLIQGILEDEGYATREAGTSERAYAVVEEKVPSLIILDIWLQGSSDDGLDILKNLKNKYPDLPFVMISGHGTIETAVSAIKDGAYDFIEKPFKSDRLLMMISRALENAELKRENAALKQRVQRSVDTLLGDSPAIESIRKIIERAAPTNSRVLITGEAGTGKDVVSRLIHKHSDRCDEPFMVLNCATLRPERLEMELFGSVQGGPDGGETTGILEQASGGTLLLDEISDMPLETQGKIIRVLQEEQFQKVGGQGWIESNVRVLATTNRDLEAAIQAGDFRQDLYYRLNVVSVAMPPLRQRSEDIATLAEYFLQNLLSQSDAQSKNFSSAACAAFKAYSWPGNIRQLKNVVEWVVIMHGGTDSAKFEPEHLPPEISGLDTGVAASGGVQSASTNTYTDLSLREAREAFEREYLLSQVERFDGNISQTAKFIGMERSALHRKLKSLQIGHDKEGGQAKVPSDQKDRKRA